MPPPNVAPVIMSADPSSVHPAAASSQRRREGLSRLVGTPHVRGARGELEGRGGRGGRPQLQRADSGVMPPTRGSKRGKARTSGGGTSRRGGRALVAANEGGGTDETDGTFPTDDPSPSSPTALLLPPGL